MLDKLILYFSAYPTVRYAALAILLISACSALLGVSLVLKRYSMIGDGLSHVSFGTAAIAAVLGLTTPIYVTLPLTVLAAVLILKLRGKKHGSGDSAIAMISCGALALGYLALNLFGDGVAEAQSDACATLFGSGILGIDLFDVILCLILSAVVITIFTAFYTRIFAVTFDEDFATATGTRVGFYNTVSAIAVGVTVVLAMNMLGALLASALIIFPALSAMRLFKTFKGVTLCAVVISLASATVGVMISLLFATAIGPTVVVADLAVFLICCLIGKIKQKN